jgi:chemotaxis protein histidine kinase CheA
MDELEQELKTIFLDEAQQLLADAKVCFAELNLDLPGDSETIVKIYRLAHNLKGSAGAVGLAEFGQFAFKVESVVTRIKKGEIKLDQNLIALLIKCNEKFCEAVQKLKENLESSFDYTPLVQEIESHLQHQSSSGSSEPSFEELSKIAHASLPRESTTHQTQVDPKKLETMMAQLGDLATIQGVLKQQEKLMRSEIIRSVVGKLSKISKNMHESLLSIHHLQPIILDGIEIDSCGCRYIVPLNQVYEICILQPGTLKSGDRETFELREEVFPVYRLSQLLSKFKPKSDSKDNFALILRYSDKSPVAVLIDEVMSQQQFAIQPLGSELNKIKGISGGAIVPDGSVALILNLSELIF